MNSSSVASTVLQGAPQLGYLGTTTSSRAKLSQALPPPSQEEEKENLYLSDLLPAGLDVHGSTSAPPQTSRYPDQSARCHRFRWSFYSNFFTFKRWN